MSIFSISKAHSTKLAGFGFGLVDFSSISFLSAIFGLYSFTFVPALKICHNRIIDKNTQTKINQYKPKYDIKSRAFIYFFLETKFKNDCG